jgi:hypothetical protein
MKKYNTIIFFVLFIFINNIIYGTNKDSIIKELKNILIEADGVVVYLYDNKFANINDKKEIQKIINFFGDKDIEKLSVYNEESVYYGIFYKIDFLKDGKSLLEKKIAVNTFFRFIAYTFNGIEYLGRLKFSGIYYFNKYKDLK